MGIILFDLLKKPCNPDAVRNRAVATSVVPRIPTDFSAIGAWTDHRDTRLRARAVPTAIVSRSNFMEGIRNVVDPREACVAMTCRLERALSIGLQRAKRNCGDRVS